MAELVYLDETGSSGRGAKQQPLLKLVGVVVGERNVSPLADALDKIARAHLGTVPPGFEFHGYELWNQKTYWAALEPSRRLAVYEDVVGVLSDLEIQVIHSSIHKEKLHEKHAGRYDDNAYLLALQFLLEKLNAWNRTELKIIVADEAKEHEAKAVPLVRDLQRWGAGAVPGKRLERVIDSIHYVDSRNSPGVQLADMVAFIMHRHSLPSQGHPAASAAVERMYGVVSEQAATWRETWPV